MWQYSVLQVMLMSESQEQEKLGSTDGCLSQ